MSSFVRYLLIGLLVWCPVAWGQPGPQVSPAPGSPPSGTFYPSPEIIRNGITPSVHLVNLEATATPTVCWVGDSTVSQGNYVAPIESQISKTEAALLQKYPNKTFTFKDYSIGGRSLSDVTTVLTSGWPSWYTNHALTWWSYVGAAGCTSLITSFGLNDTGFESANNWATYLTSVVASYPNKTEDIIISTNISAWSQAGSPYNTQPYQSGYLSNAALQRNLAWSGLNLNISGLSPIGLIDIGRYFQMSILGRDPVEQILSYAIPPSTPVVAGTTGTGTFTYTLPNTDGDFDLIIGLNNGSSFPGSGTNVIIPLCANASGIGATNGLSCFVDVVPNSGTACYTNMYITSPEDYIPGFANSWSSTNNTIEVSVQSGHIQVYCNGTKTIDGIYPIAEGNAFTPLISLTTPPNNTIVTISSYAYGTMRKYTPTITPAACYGSYPNGIDSGNGINHVASDCLNGVYQPVIESAFQPGASSIGTVGSFIPTTGQIITIPTNQTFTAINPAGTLAALTVNLPTASAQGSTTRFTTNQAITALTIGAPSGYTISGGSVSGATVAAGATYAYSLIGTIWYRIQ